MVLLRRQRGDGGGVGQVAVDADPVGGLRVLDELPRGVELLAARRAREVGGFCNEEEKKVEVSLRSEISGA